jgi:glycosyltransferase involved in cell wall biosynthesis
MRILLLTQWFSPEPDLKGLAFARCLRDRGHDVEVLTGFPNYPGGRLYSGYRVRPFQREVMDGIRVNRVPLYPSHDRSGIRRIVNYLSFGATAASLGPWVVRRPDVVYVYNLVTLGWAARMLRWFRGAKTVLDVQDLWPESVMSSGMMRNRVLQKVLNRWCRREYLSPNRLVVLSPGFKAHLAQLGVPESKIEVIYNWCDETSIKLTQASDATRAELKFPGRFNIVFAGTMGVMQGLDVVLECAWRLAAEAPDVLFTLIGGGVESQRLRAASAGLPNVQVLPPRPQSEIGEVLAAADVLLVHLKDDPLFRITIPSKIQAYLYVGKPILCGLHGDAADLVRRAKAGACFEPGNAGSLADAVLKLRRLPAQDLAAIGDAGQQFYRDHLALERGVASFEKLFHDVCER